MNNEILSCAENRDTSENARGNKSAATVAKGLLFRFCRGNAKRTTLTTLEGWFVPAGYISYFAIFAVVPDGRVYDFAAPFSTVRSLARSLARTRYKLYVIVVLRKSSWLLFRQMRMMMKKTTMVLWYGILYDNIFGNEKLSCSFGRLFDSMRRRLHHSGTAYTCMYVCMYVHIYLYIMHSKYVEPKTWRALL